MEAFMDFLDSLWGGLELLALSAVVGGLVWSFHGLKALGAPDPALGPAVRRSLALIAAGAAGLAVAQAGEILAKAYLLALTISASPFPALFETTVFIAGSARLAIALPIALLSLRLLARGPTRAGWLQLSVLTLAALVVTAWLAHGASRIEGRAWLMTVTALHTASAAVWVGGVIHLVGLWRLVRRKEAPEALWRASIRRFSGIGIGAVGVMALTALPLADFYIGEWAGLIGTGYGALVLVKSALVLVALAFAALNFRAGRRSGAAAAGGGIMRAVPHYIEAELLVLVVILFTAAAVSSQPPAIDITEERAAWQEVAGMFAPTRPRLATPSFAEMPKGPRNILADSREAEHLDKAWSEFSHNVAGVFVTAISVMALASRSRRFRWCRHWPLGFAALAVFLFFRNAPAAWTEGPLAFFQGLDDAERVQHRIAIVLACGLGLVEWRARTVPRPAGPLPYVFPLLCLVGGLLLITHSHAAFEIKSEYLIQVTHTAMAALAVVIACTRWLELRLEPGPGRAAGLASVVAMLFVGLILAIYREPFDMGASRLVVASGL